MSVTQMTSTTQFDGYLKNNTFVVVDFFATWCPPCKAIHPQLEKLAKQYGDAGSLAFVQVDVDAQQELARRFEITAMPTFKVFENGKEIQSIRGANLPALTAAVQSAVQSIKIGAEKKTQPSAPAASAENTTSVSGGYTLSKGSDWKMSLN